MPPGDVGAYPVGARVSTISIHPTGTISVMVPSLMPSSLSHARKMTSHEYPAWKHAPDVASVSGLPLSSTLKIVNVGSGALTTVKTFGPPLTTMTSWVSAVWYP